MTTEDFIITLFCEIDEQLGPLPTHPQATLWPSEIVTIGVLFALKGDPFRAFARWLRRDYDPLFGHFPHRTRLPRLLIAPRAGVSAFSLCPRYAPLLIPMGVN